MRLIGQILSSGHNISSYLYNKTMVVSWGTSEPVVSRIMRNMKGVEASYMEDIKEWIAEAIGKMKTPHTVIISPNKILVEGYRAKLPCKIDGLVSVAHEGCRIPYNANGRIVEHCNGSAGDTLFKSISPIYTTVGELTDPENGRSKFPRDFIVRIAELPIDYSHWYKVSGKYLETDIQCGILWVFTSGLPKDENGFPLIPEVEEYEEAVYRYVRLMLIEAGYEDKVMSHATADQKWWTASGLAITAVSFPTPEEVAGSINRNVKLFGAELWDGFTFNYDM